MIPHTEPERPAMLDWQKLQLDQQWRKGEVGSVTYLRTLFLIGYAPRDAQIELNLLRLEKQPDYEARRLQASRDWMEDRR
jgi:hypothetical protein